MKNIEKLAKIMESDIKSKIGTLKKEDEKYINFNYITDTVKNYIEENNITNIKIDYTNVQAMLNFINIQVLSYIK